MPRQNKVWYWKARKQWCVKINGKRHMLGPDNEEAERKFHAMKANPEKEIAKNSLLEALDAFLAWTHENRAERTHERYQELLQSFIDFVGDIPIESVKAFLVQQWFEQHDWNSTTQNTAGRAIKRALNWAEDMGYCDRNPISGMTLPKSRARTSTISVDEFDELISHVHDRNFSDLLMVSYDSGSRPQEINRLEARHIQLDKQRAVIPTDEAKKGIPRAIYLPTDRSLAIIKRLMIQHPSGLLFRNTKGRQWTRSAIKCRFARLEEKVGKRFRQYDLRRTWITGKIKAGVDSHVVASLSGHQSTQMIDRHYSVIADDPEFMLNQAKTTKENGAS